MPEQRPSETVTERARLHRTGSDTRKRTQVVALRMTPDEHAEITAFAAARDLTVGELLRASWTYIRNAESIKETTHV